MKNKKKNKLSEEEVKHIARLAKLSLTPQEVKKFQKLLSDTISYVGKLKELNTKDVCSTSQVTGLKNVFKDDEIGQSISQKDALSNAKETCNDFFKVKAIFK